MKTRFCLERLLCVGVSSCLLTMLLHRITHGNLALTSVIFILPVYLLLYRCGTGSFARVFLGRAPPEPGARGRTILKEIAASAGYGAIVAALEQAKRRLAVGSVWPLVRSPSTLWGRSRSAA